jgi:hypothetical protein
LREPREGGDWTFHISHDGCFAPRSRTMTRALTGARFSSPHHPSSRHSRTAPPPRCRPHPVPYARSTGRLSSDPKIIPSCARLASSPSSKRKSTTPSPRTRFSNAAKRSPSAHQAAKTALCSLLFSKPSTSATTMALISFCYQLMRESKATETIVWRR